MSGSVGIGPSGSLVSAVIPLSPQIITNILRSAAQMSPLISAAIPSPREGLEESLRAVESHLREAAGESPDLIAAEVRRLPSQKEGGVSNGLSNFWSRSDSSEAAQD